MHAKTGFPMLISLKNIRKSFQNSVKAIDHLSLDVNAGEFLSLLGPSGCGKTTLLRLIAGLEVPDSGSIVIGDQVVSGDKWVPAEKRSVGIVFQGYALFPHMTVFENLAFGLGMLGSHERRKRVERMLDLVGISEMAKRYPHELSGGQQQRVALARALAPAPQVLLLDEPFSNLDADLRFEIGTETKRILKETNTTAILVTHDQEESFSLSDRVGVLNQGTLEQVGTPYAIYHTPTTRFAANFVGRADFFPAQIKNQTVISSLGVFKLSGEKKMDDGNVDIMVRPDDVDFDEAEHGNAVIIDQRFLGPDVIYRLKMKDGQVIHSIKPSTLAHDLGTHVHLKVNPTHVVVFPSNGHL
jgi:iron(III) transport system ATP-binding protein